MIRVGVSALAIEPGRPSGARARLAEATGRAAERLGEAARFLVYAPRGVTAADLGRLGAAANATLVEAPFAPGGGIFRRLEERRWLEARAASDELDVLDVSPLLAPAEPPERTRLVITVHDLRAFHGRGPGAWARRAGMRSALRRAGATVVAVSTFTAREIERFAGVAAVVVPNGVDAAFFEPPPPVAVALAREPFVLWVGHLEPRKDPVTMVRAFGLLGGGLSLVMVGADAGAAGATRRAIARAPNRERIALVPPVGRDALRALYRCARAFVVTSRYEGFCLPVLEAMASGTPVVASLAGAIPEVAGDAAHYAPPGDPTAFAGAINRVLQDGPVRADLVRSGLARAHHFSWQPAANSLSELYINGV